EIGDELVDQFENGRRGPEASVEGKVVQFAFGLERLERELQPGAFELDGIGALETEYRLLEIPHREDRAMRRSARSGPGEIFLGESMYDRPLPAVGVLRLVDEDM